MLAIILLPAPQVLAQEQRPPGSTSTEPTTIIRPKLTHLSGSIRGTATIASGACVQGIDGFAKQCPSGHCCICYVAMDAKFSSSGIGNGAGNFFGTLDASASFGALGSSCAPLYAEMDVVAKKDSPNFDLVGAACNKPTGGVVSNGAMGLAASKLFTSGYATYTGTLPESAGLSGGDGRLVLKFEGAVQ
jgi:hypothetical protein